MKFMTIFLLLTSLAHAQVSQVQITNFNFSYNAPLGEGLADSFSYQKLNQGQKVQVEKFADVFKIHLEGVENQEFELKGAPSFIQEAEAITLSQFNLNLSDRAGLSLAQGHFTSTQDDLSLKNLNLSCDRSGAMSVVMDQVIAGCVQKMNFKVSSFSSFSDKGLIKAFHETLNESFISQSSSLSIKNVDLKINAGKYQLTADVKAQISGTVTSSGNMSYDGNSKKLTIKISEVKFGIIDLTSKVFEELKKQESASLKVSKPYVYLTVK